MQRKHVFAIYFMYSKLFANKVSKCRTYVLVTHSQKTRHYYSLINQCNHSDNLKYLLSN